DTRPIDRYFLLDGADHGGDEADVVTIGALRLAAAGPGVPGAHESVRVGDQKMPGVGFAIPVIGAFGLRPGSEAAVQHHHQRRTVAQPRWTVQMECSADPADVDGLRGLPDRNRLRTRCSQCVTATDASAE